MTVWKEITSKARKTSLTLAFLLATLVAASCGTAIGDNCSDDSDCPTIGYCDRAMPGGYCTLENCREDDCPDGSVCVEFDNQERFCMAQCDGDGDCRDGYSCISDVGPSPFCSVRTP